MIDTDAFYNTLIDRVQGLLSQRGDTRIGVVTAYQPFQVQVQIYPEGFITDWIQLEAVAIGNGFGVIAAPNIGDICVVEPINGDYDTLIARTRLFSDGFVPPDAQAGEIWIVHASGSLLKFTSDGIITVNGSSNLVIQTTGDVDVTSQGNVNVTAQQATITAPTVEVDGNLVVSGGITFGSGASGAVMQGTGNISLTGAISSTGEVTANGIPLTGHKHPYLPGTGSQTDTGSSVA